MFSWSLEGLQSSPTDWHQRTCRTSKLCLGTKVVGTWLPYWSKRSNQVGKAQLFSLLRDLKGNQRKLLPQLDMGSYLNCDSNSSCNPDLEALSDHCCFHSLSCLRLHNSLLPQHYRFVMSVRPYILSCQMVSPIWIPPSHDFWTSQSTSLSSHDTAIHDSPPLYKRLHNR